MSGMVENGSSGGGLSLPPGESHDEFLELCALATTEWLSPEERKRLDAHIAGCPSCRELLREYEALVAQGVPAADFERTDSAPRWSLEDAETALFARLEREGSAAASRPSADRPTPAIPDSSLAPPPDTLWRHLWLQYAAGLLLAVALGYSLYRTGIDRGTQTARAAFPRTTESADSARVASAEASASAGREAAELRRDDLELAALRTRTARESRQLAQLGAEKSKLDRSVAGEQASRGIAEQQRDDLAGKLDAARTELQEVRGRLEATAAQSAADELKLAALRRQISDLSAGADEKDQELAREQQLLDHDRDIRDLMGSRDLYIAEVYDVDKSGDTERPFGRVFYTKGKSLIFYAYDLDQQPGARAASTFQAWGRRGPDQDRAVNLGILYVDNAQKKRWILRAENPKRLADIDAVFVTVEPAGGSSHPSGKPVLFTYLRIEPNHP